VVWLLTNNFACPKKKGMIRVEGCVVVWAGNPNVDNTKVKEAKKETRVDEMM